MSEKDTDVVINVRFHARGGQGGVTAAQLVVEAFDGMGRAQPKFGAERMGSPTAAYATVSKNPDLVQAQNEVYTPQYVAVLDQTLLMEMDVTTGMPPGGTVLVNTSMTFENLKKLLKRKDVNVAKVDATKIAMDIIKRPITNTAILGALVKISDFITLEELEQALFRTFTEKVAKVNVDVIKRAYNEVEIEKCGVELDLSKSEKPQWSHVKPDLPGYEDVATGAVWYKPGASEKVQTGTWGIYHIHWDEEKCINCHRCFLVCPDLSIMRKQQPDGTWKVIGVDNYHCKACRCCVEVCPKNALTAVEKKIGVHVEAETY
ncbi:MAG: 2-oxoacid:acceptor oxidoreductase family protein [Candidatus Helarchaeales archaeon]